MGKRVYALLLLVILPLFAACDVFSDIIADISDSHSVAVPSAPGAASVKEENTQLSLYWTAVSGAASYEVWFSDANDSSLALRQGGDITATDYRLTELTNKTRYYVWLKAKNVAGTSGFSPVAAGIPVVLYYIGDTGPGGGLVFYDKGSFSDGWRYMEAAPASTEWMLKWWEKHYTLIGGTGTAIGDGRANTAAIVTWMDNNSEVDKTDRPAYLCDTLVYGGSDDWFLPSIDELVLVFENLQVSGIGGFSPWYYWSSSEYADDQVRVQDFTITGGYGTTVIAKNLASRVRAVRMF
jgi:hypothetical protein